MAPLLLDDGLLGEGETLLSDPTLAYNYWESVRRKAYTDFTKWLMLAVLEDAVAILQRHRAATKPGKRRLFQDAAEWIFVDEDESRLFSCRMVCEVLGINIDYLRRGLTQEKFRQLILGRKSKRRAA
jgi:hypothetical protein